MPGEILGSNPIWVVMESGYTAEYGKPIVNLYSRNYNNPTESITHSFPYEPYFYCPAEESHKSHSLIIRVEPDILVDAKGRNIRKVVVRLPSDVRSVRDMYSWTDESDVLFDKRFLVDYKIRYAYEIIDGLPVPVEVEHPMEPFILYYDIETWADDGGFSKPIDVYAPIVTIQVGTNYDERITVFTYLVDDIGDPDQVCCESEQELIKMFCMYVRELNPDIAAAWSSDQYDVPYIINRAIKLGISVDGLSRYGNSRLDYNPKTGKFRHYIPGRAFFDQMEAFKKYNIGKGQRESNGLKSIISDKDLFKGSAFSYPDLGPIMDVVMREKRFKELIEYCKNDVRALRVIDKQLGLFNFFETTRCLAGNKIMDGLHNSIILETYVMHEGIKPMPRKMYSSKEKEKFKGALVVTPTVGIHEWTLTVDLNALYPHIIVGFGVSPDVDGVVARSTKKLMDLREVYREQSKHGILGASARSSSAKGLVNSVFGIMGAESARLYDREKAEFITQTGQELNRYIQELCAKSSKSVIYGDTDSVFLSKVYTGSDAIEFESYLNRELAKWSDEHGSKVHFKLKAEKLFRRLLFKPKSSNRNVPGKKKYAGHLIWEEGEDCDELKYMGIEVRRSDNPNIAKECLIEFLNCAIIDGDMTKAINCVREKYKSILNGKVNILDISIPKEVRKLDYENKNSWIDGQVYAKSQYNYTIQEGEKPRLIYLTDERVICIDDGFDTSKIYYDVDWKKMAEKCIKDKMESYIWSIGMSWVAAIDGQQSLDTWFG